MPGYVLYLISFPRILNTHLPAGGRSLQHLGCEDTRIGLGTKWRAWTGKRTGKSDRNVQVIPKVKYCFYYVLSFWFSCMVFLFLIFPFYLFHIAPATHLLRVVVIAAYLYCSFCLFLFIFVFFLLILFLGLMYLREFKPRPDRSHVDRGKR